LDALFEGDAPDPELIDTGLEIVGLENRSRARHGRMVSNQVTRVTAACAPDGLTRTHRCAGPIGVGDQLHAEDVDIEITGSILVGDRGRPPATTRSDGVPAGMGNS
jgi:hypothetical protein